MAPKTLSLEPRKDKLPPRPPNFKPGARTSAQNHPEYKRHLDGVIRIVKQYAGWEGLQCDNIATAHFKKDLHMDRTAMYGLKVDFESSFFTKIHPEDASQLRCCEDLANYFSGGKKAMRAERKAARELSKLTLNSSTPAPSTYKECLDAVTAIVERIHMASTSAQNHPKYKRILDKVTVIVKHFAELAGLQCDNVATADFKNDLNMDRETMRSLKLGFETAFYTKIHPEDGSQLRCSEDLAKYYLYGKADKTAERKTVRKAAKELAALKLNSHSKHMSCQDSPTYKECLDAVTSIIKRISRKQQVTPTADFKKDLCTDLANYIMSKDCIIN